MPLSYYTKYYHDLYIHQQISRETITRYSLIVKRGFVRTYSDLSLIIIGDRSLGTHLFFVIVFLLPKRIILW